MPRKKKQDGKSAPAGNDGSAPIPSAAAQANASAPEAATAEKEPAEKEAADKAADKKAAQKFERRNEGRFAPGGPMDYERHPEGKGMKCVAVIFVDNDGAQYPARILPLPTNRGNLTEIPSLADPYTTLQKITRLPLEKQVEALREYHEALAKPAPALLLNGTVVRLVEHDGELHKTMEKGDGFIPVVDLLVNFSKRPDKEDWKLRQNVRPEAFAGLPAKGEKPIPHYKRLPK
ncbi:MAG: hypothetical protein KIS92_00925 [Planctomycetota bacterium]|nr:hypothetical protein [Planctomycetota bacterium]